MYGKQGTPTKSPATPTKHERPSSMGATSPQKSAASSIDDERYDEAVYPFSSCIHFIRVSLLTLLDILLIFH